MQRLLLHLETPAGSGSYWPEEDGTSFSLIQHLLTKATKCLKHGGSMLGLAGVKDAQVCRRSSGLVELSAGESSAQVTR